MKKVLLTFAVAGVFALTSCGGAKKTEEKKDTAKVEVKEEKTEEKKEEKVEEKKDSTAKDTAKKETVVAPIEEKK